MAGRRLPRAFSEPSCRRVLRIGPFASRGAGTKHAIGMENVVAAGECVAASLLSPVTEAGELVGEPPIGVHHVHVLSHTSIMQDVKAQAGCS